MFTFATINQQTAGFGKKYYSLEWPAYQDKHVDGPNISVSWTGTKLGPNMYFVNKQLTDVPYPRQYDATLDLAAMHVLYLVKSVNF